MRKLYGALLAALGLLLLLRLANGSSMLQLAGVLMVLAGVAVAFLRHADDAPPLPSDAAPADAALADHAPSDTAPSDPSPSDPPNTDPTPTDPTPTDPASAPPDSR